MITFDSVSKSFGELEVLKGLKFKIGEGEVVGLLGPNGAGKTTTLRILTGILPPSSGTVRIDGRDPLEDSEVKRRIGFLPENNPLYDDLTVEEWLKFWSEIKHEGAISMSQIKEAVELSGLEEVYYRFVGELSKGYRQRVGLAQAILDTPNILVLDEPTEGLDPNQRQDIHKLIKHLGTKKTVIISSHVLAEITKMCSRVLILNQGRIAADGSPEELAAGISGQQVVVAHLQGRGVLTALKKIKGVSDVVEEKEGKNGASRYTVSSDSKENLGLEVFEAAKKNNWKLYELTRKQAGLEEVFTRLTAQ